MKHISEFIATLTPDQVNKFKAIPTEELQQFLGIQIAGAAAQVSTMTPEQVKAVSGSFALSLLAEASADQGIDIKDLDLRINFITGKTTFKCNGEKRESKQFGSMQHYGNTLKPLVDEQAKLHKMEKQETFSLRCNLADGFDMVILGTDAEGSPIKFAIEPVKVIQFAMENSSKIG